MKKASINYSDIGNDYIVPNDTGYEAIVIDGIRHPGFAAAKSYLIRECYLTNREAESYLNRMLSQCGCTC